MVVVVAAAVAAAVVAAVAVAVAVLEEGSRPGYISRTPTGDPVHGLTLPLSLTLTLTLMLLQYPLVAPRMIEVMVSAEHRQWLVP